MIVFAYALTKGETTEAYGKLIRACISQGMALNEENIVVISDRGAAVIAAVETWLPNCFHMFCEIHLSRNLIQKGLKKYLEYFVKARSKCSETKSAC